jgi:hypothetical protein
MCDAVFASYVELVEIVVISGSHKISLVITIIH